MAGRTGVGPQWGNVRTLKIDFANFLTLSLTVDCTTKLTDVLRSLTDSIKQHPSYTGLRIEAESHDLSSPRLELEGRTTPESPSPLSSIQQVMSQHPRAEYSTFCLPPFPSYPIDFCLVPGSVFSWGSGRCWSNFQSHSHTRKQGKGPRKHPKRLQDFNSWGQRLGQGGQEGAIYTGS